MISFSGNDFLFSTCSVSGVSRFRCMTVDIVSRSTERFTKQIRIHEIVRHIIKKRLYKVPIKDRIDQLNNT